MIKTLSEQLKEISEQKKFRLEKEKEEEEHDEDRMEED
jgi:hypothetical protein